VKKRSKKLRKAQKRSKMVQKSSKIPARRDKNAQKSAKKLPKNYEFSHQDTRSQRIFKRRLTLIFLPQRRRNYFVTPSTLLRMVSLSNQEGTEVTEITYF
jgi:hypothetical protein